MALKEFQDLCLNLIATIATDNTMVVAYLRRGRRARFVPYYGESRPGAPGKRFKPDTFTLQPCPVRDTLRQDAMSSFSLLINAVILLLNCLVLILYFYIHFLSLRHHFSLLQHYLDLHITDTAPKVSRALYCFILLYLMVFKIFPQAVRYRHI